MASQRSYLDILNITEIKAHIQAYLHKADSEKGLNKSDTHCLQRSTLTHHQWGKGILQNEQK